MDQLVRLKVEILSVCVDLFGGSWLLDHSDKKVRREEASFLTFDLKSSSVE